MRNKGTTSMPEIPAFTTPLSPAAFFAWLERAEPGQRLAYHRGFLARDRSPTSKLAEADRRTVAEIAEAVFRAAGHGRVHLVQRRHGPFDFSYLAIKAGRVATAPAGAVPPVEQALAA
jgi:hypothetical protein